MFILLFAPLLRRLSIRRRVMVGLPVLFVGVALIFASGALAALSAPGGVLSLAGLIMVVSAVLRRPRPDRLAGVRQQTS